MALPDNLGLIVILILIPLSTYLMIDFFRQETSNGEQTGRSKEDSNREKENDT